MPSHTSTVPPARTLVVTGASGFLGGVVAKCAREAGWRVFAASRSAAGAGANDGFWWHFNEGVAVEEAADWLRSVRPDAVFHGAGSADVRKSFEEPWQDMRASLDTWSFWLEAARLSEASPLMILPSSAAVYGSPESLPVREECDCRPISPYGMHKWMCEKLAEEYHGMLGLPVAVVRLFSIFGSSQRRLLVWELFQKLKDGRQAVRLMGTGRERRDFLHETSVAEAVLRLGSGREDFPASGPMPVYNLGAGVEHSVLEVAGMLRDRLSPGREIVCEGLPRQGDPDRWCADVTQFRTAFRDWSPVGLEEGIDRTIADWLSDRKGEAP